MVGGVVYPPFMKETTIREMRRLCPRKRTDIVIATFPKCGTTWMQQIVLTLLAGGDASKVRDPMKMSPWSELRCCDAPTAFALIYLIADSSCCRNAEPLCHRHRPDHRRMERMGARGSLTSPPPPPPSDQDPRARAACPVDRRRGARAARRRTRDRRDAQSEGRVCLDVSSLSGRARLRVSRRHRAIRTAQASSY